MEQRPPSYKPYPPFSNSNPAADDLTTASIAAANILVSSTAAPHPTIMERSALSESYSSAFASPSPYQHGNHYGLPSASQLPRHSSTPPRSRPQDTRVPPSNLPPLSGSGRDGRPVASPSSQKPLPAASLGLAHPPLSRSTYQAGAVHESPDAKRTSVRQSTASGTGSTPYLPSARPPQLLFSSSREANLDFPALNSIPRASNLGSAMSISSMLRDSQPSAPPYSSPSLPLGSSTTSIRTNPDLHPSSRHPVVLPPVTPTPALASLTTPALTSASALVSLSASAPPPSADYASFRRPQTPEHPLAIGRLYDPRSAGLPSSPQRTYYNSPESQPQGHHHPSQPHQYHSRSQLVQRMTQQRLDESHTRAQPQAQSYVQAHAHTHAQAHTHVHAHSQHARAPAHNQTQLHSQAHAQAQAQAYAHHLRHYPNNGSLSVHGHTLNSPAMDLELGCDSSRLPPGTGPRAFSPPKLLGDVSRQADVEVSVRRPEDRMHTRPVDVSRPSTVEYNTERPGLRPFAFDERFRPDRNHPANMEYRDRVRRDRADSGTDVGRKLPLHPSDYPTPNLHRLSQSALSRLQDGRSVEYQHWAYQPEDQAGHPNIEQQNTRRPHYPRPTQTFLVGSAPRQGSPAYSQQQSDQNVGPAHNAQPSPARPGRAQMGHFGSPDQIGAKAVSHMQASPPQAPAAKSPRRQMKVGSPEGPVPHPMPTHTVRTLQRGDSQADEYRAMSPSLRRPRPRPREDVMAPSDMFLIAAGLGSAHGESGRVLLPDEPPGLNIHQRNILIQEIGRKGRVSPLPQAVQGAQSQLHGPTGEPGIKSEFGRMFSGIGSGVGISSPVTSMAQLAFRSSSLARRDEAELSTVDSANEAASMVPARPAKRIRKRKLEEDSKEYDSGGRASPISRAKRVKHRSRAGPDQPSSPTRGSALVRKKIGSRFSSPTNSQAESQAPVPVLTKAALGGTKAGAREKPVCLLPMPAKPRYSISSKAVLEAVADRPRVHLGVVLYNPVIKPCRLVASVRTHRGFSTTPRPLPMSLIRDCENCTVTVKVPRVHLSVTAREEITSRRAVWGTDVYSDDSDVVAACIHAGWIQGAWVDEVDVDMLVADTQDREVKNDEDGTGDLSDKSEKSDQGDQGDRGHRGDKSDNGGQDGAAVSPLHKEDPVAIPANRDLDVTLVVLPKLVHYMATARYGISSREWGGGGGVGHRVTAPHDGLSYMILSVRWVENGAGQQSRLRGRERRERIRQALWQVRQVMDNANVISAASARAEPEWNDVRGIDVVGHPKWVRHGWHGAESDTTANYDEGRPMAIEAGAEGLAA